MSKEKDKPLLGMLQTGIVAETKSRDTHEIMIIPMEAFRTLMGNLGAGSFKQEVTGIRFDKKATPYTKALNMGIAIPAKWKQLTNVNTSPDVVAGETVYFFQVGDSDEYYWDSAGRNENLRTLETKVFAISATPDPHDNEKTIDNCYIFTMSSHDGHMTLTTSKANGEACTYIFQFNTLDGTWTLEDDIGNHGHLNSVEHLWEFLNASNSLFQMDKKVINFKCDDSFNLEATNEVNVTTKKFTLNATDSVQINTNKFVTDCPDNTFTGNMKIGGNCAVGGGLSVGAGGTGLAAGVAGGGGAEIKGDVDVTGSFSSTGDVTCPNIKTGKINGIPVSAYLN